MNNIETKTSVLFFVILIATNLFVRFKEYDNFYDIINEYTSNCYYDNPEPYLVDPPFQRSIRWCSDDKLKMSNLIKHMMIECKGCKVTIAPEYGSNVKVIFFPRNNIILINPIVNLYSNTVIECLDMIGDTKVKTIRPKEIDVHFTNGSFEKDNMKFVDGDACIIQTTIDLLNGDDLTKQ